MPQSTSSPKRTPESSISAGAGGGAGRPTPGGGGGARGRGCRVREGVAAYVYNTATGQGLGWRVPNAPFVMETFCMGDHGIVSGYRADAAGKTEPVLLSPVNHAAVAWGLRLYRSTLYAFCAALEGDGGLNGNDVRPLVHEVMDAFWCHPTQAEALAWGAYPYDSDPAGTAVRPLARPFP